MTGNLGRLLNIGRPLPEDGKNTLIESKFSGAKRFLTESVHLSVRMYVRMYVCSLYAWPIDPLFFFLILSMNNNNCNSCREQTRIHVVSLY